MRALAILPTLVIALAAAGPADAQSRRELDERLRAVEDQLRAAPGDDAVVRMMDRMNALEAQIRNLTGQVEELQYENRQLQDEMETLRDDMVSAMRGPARGPMADPGFGAGPDDGGPTRLTGPAGDGADNRDFAIVDPDDPFAAQRSASVRPLGESMDPAPQSEAEAGAEDGMDLAYSPSGDNPDLLFARGRTRLFEGNFGQALEAFAEFLDTAPQDPRAGEAWFWVGSIYRSEERPQAAADALVRSLQTDEDGPMAPEAMVQLGAALAELGETEAACQTLQQSVQRYSGMDPAVRATANREMRGAGC